MPSDSDPAFDDVVEQGLSGRLVDPRPCIGVSAAKGPLHPRPARLNLRMMAVYAVDYGVRRPNGRMVDMNLHPILDLIAAQYAGCSPCAERWSDAVAAVPALTTHLVGAALSALSDAGAGASASIVYLKLREPGAAIALTMRVEGLLAAVDVAAAMPATGRRTAVDGAVGCLLPVGWLNNPLSNFFESGGKAADGDTDMLGRLTDWLPRP